MVLAAGFALGQPLKTASAVIRVLGINRTENGVSATVIVQTPCKRLIMETFGKAAQRG